MTTTKTAKYYNLRYEGGQDGSSTVAGLIDVVLALRSHGVTSAELREIEATFVPARDTENGPEQGHWDETLISSTQITIR